MQQIHQKFSKYNFNTQYGTQQPQVRMSRAEKKLLRARARKDTLHGKNRGTLTVNPRVNRGLSLALKSIIGLMQKAINSISNATKHPKLQQIHSKLLSLSRGFFQLRQSAVSMIDDYQQTRRSDHRPSTLKQ